MAFSVFISHAWEVIAVPLPPHSHYEGLLPKHAFSSEYFSVVLGCLWGLEMIVPPFC